MIWVTSGLITIRDNSTLWLVTKKGLCVCISVINLENSFSIERKTTMSPWQSTLLTKLALKQCENAQTQKNTSHTN